jgi:hypothetical protein
MVTWLNPPIFSSTFCFVYLGFSKTAPLPFLAKPAKFQGYPGVILSFLKPFFQV